MSSEPTGIDALDQYRNVSKKLKKTFFKKPNENEALESYISLARELENFGLLNYAGLCLHAAAKCENSLGNITGEATNLLKSARQYARAEERNVCMGSVTLGSDNLQAALDAYSSAISKYEKDSPLAVNINLETVKLLERVGRRDLVRNYLRNAIESCSDGGLLKQHCLHILAINLIESGDYAEALDTFTELFNLVKELPDSGSNADILLECEVNRIFLLLILKPPTHKLTQELTKILERYTWGDKNDESLKSCRMSEFMFVLLESLVTTCQSADTSTLVELEEQFWPLLTRDQRNLLRILVRIYLK